jgi:hypothetical protein
MSATISTTLAEIYLQHMDQYAMYPILIKYDIIGYFRYADYILIIYDNNKTNIIRKLQYLFFHHTMGTEPAYWRSLSYNRTSLTRGLEVRPNVFYINESMRYSAKGI